jgi:CRISPR-associated protein Csd1
VLGLDSASPGRLSITYYRELTGSDFLKRIEKWHSDLAWKQRISIEDDAGKNKVPKIIWPICAPAPKDIARAVYGFRSEKDKNHAKVIKATVERLLPCIIDGLPIPRDLVDSTVHRACNRVGLEHWEWEKVLGIACSLYKGYYLKNLTKKGVTLWRLNLIELPGIIYMGGCSRLQSI